MGENAARGRVGTCGGSTAAGVGRALTSGACGDEVTTTVMGGLDRHGWCDDDDA
ncbi:MFS transporter [Sesbania bispinosa]|nr:MFS transporter [Sesbania bispinosa]